MRWTGRFCSTGLPTMAVWREKKRNMRRKALTTVHPLTWPTTLTAPVISEQTFDKPPPSISLQVSHSAVQ